MTSHPRALLLPLLLLLLCSRISVGAADPIRDIAFGSCLNKTEHVMLDRALTLPMDLFIFLGDNVYSDTTEMSEMRAKYDALKASRFFRELRQKATILATWDDHDFGLNDGGAAYTKRKESQAEFLRWLDEPEDSPRRKREGVYDAQIFGPEGKRLQVILLDTRYFRGPLRKIPITQSQNLGGPYLPSTDRASTMLGEAQWRWLEGELKKPAEVRVICSSIQFVSEFSGAEAWANLPHEKERMLELLASTKANGVVFISGDRHWVELSKMPGRAGYPLYDLTASAMTVPHPRGTPSANKYRAVPTTYHDVNAGHLHIDWDQPDPELTLKIIDFRGATRIEQKIKLSTLQPTP